MFWGDDAALISLLKGKNVNFPEMIWRVVFFFVGQHVLGNGAWCRKINRHSSILYYHQFYFSSSSEKIFFVLLVEELNYEQRLG